MLCPLKCIFQRDGSPILEKDISGNTEERLGEDLHIFQRNRGRIYNCKFSKVNSIRKVRSGASSQEEICLKFPQS